MGKKSGKKESGGRERSNIISGEEKYQVNSLKDLNSENLKGVLMHNRYAQMLLGLVIIGFTLRFYNLGFNSLWLDEATTLTYARMSLVDIFGTSITSEFHPPLFYWIENLMISFGEMEFILRFIPALLGTLTIPIFYFIGRETLNRDTGIIMSLLVVFSPFHIFYSQEARSYSMMLIFFSIALLSYILAIKYGQKKWWIAFGIFSALAFWTHYYTAIGIGLIVFHAIILNSQKIRNDATFRKNFFEGLILLIIISIPLMYIVIERYLELTSKMRLGSLGLSLISDTIINFSVFNGIIALIFTTFFIVGLYVIYQKNRSFAYLYAMIMVLTLIISVILSAKMSMNARYLIYLLPVFFVCIAATCTPISKFLKTDKFVYFFMAVLILLSVPFMLTYYTVPSKNDWRGFSVSISELTNEGDYVIILPGYMKQPFDYYYNNESDKTIEFGLSRGLDIEKVIQGKPNSVAIYYIFTWDIAAANPEGDSIDYIQANAKPLGQYMGIYVFKS